MASLTTLLPVQAHMRLYHACLLLLLLLSGFLSWGDRAARHAVCGRDVVECCVRDTKSGILFLESAAAQEAAATTGACVQGGRGTSKDKAAISAAAKVARGRTLCKATRRVPCGPRIITTHHIASLIFPPTSHHLTHNTSTLSAAAAPAQDHHHVSGSKHVAQGARPRAL